MNAYRIDTNASQKPQLDSYGILRCSATVARVGIQNYRKPDGTILRELRSPEDVQESAASFSALPVTLNHPSTLVTSDNASDYSKGLSGDCQYKDGKLGVMMTVTHADAIASATTTHRQVSCGYTCDLDPTSGIWTDSFGVMGAIGNTYEYDAVQRNIRGNHIALVERGRAGAIASLHLDSEDVAESIDETSIEAPVDVPLISNIQIDMKELEILQAKFDAAEIELIAVKANNVVLTGDLAAAKAELSAKVDVADLMVTDECKSAIATEISTRLDLWQELLPFFQQTDADFKADHSLDADGIKKAYLKSKMPTLVEKIDSASSDYVAALWDVSKPEANIIPEVKTDSTDSLKTAVDNVRTQPKRNRYDGTQEVVCSDITARRKQNLGK